MSEKKVLILGFEVPYSDNSGVEYGVLYDSEGNDFKGGKGTVQFKSIGEPVEFPADRIGWLIECLERIAKEVAKMD